MANTLKKVLIAEDEKALAKVLALKMKGAGFDPVIAENGEEAMSALKNDDIALVILDLVMPKMDGFAVLEAIKSAGIKVPVIVTSNLSQQEDVARAKKLGAVEFFVKSDTPLTNIVTAVSALLK